MNPNQRTPAHFCRLLNETYLDQIHENGLGVTDEPIQVCEDTARRWMLILGFQLTSSGGKNFYVDGHERPDVVEYRQQFLQRFLQYESRMSEYSGDNMDEVQHPANVNEREMVWVFHDESTFYANDGTRLIWQDDQTDLIPKTNGSSLMVSAFMCPCHGMMCDEGEVSYKLFKAGTNRDGWWDNADLVNQLQQVIPIVSSSREDCSFLLRSKSKSSCSK
jgi:hypothetical protein